MCFFMRYQHTNYKIQLQTLQSSKVAIKEKSARGVLQKKKKMYQMSF